QSILPPRRYGMDCFAEPVIRPRFARTGWLAMTLRMADSGCGALRVAGEPREQRFRRILRRQACNSNRRLRAHATLAALGVAHHGCEPARDPVRVTQVGIGKHHDDGAVALHGAEIGLPHQPADDPRAIELCAGIVGCKAEARDREPAAIRKRLADGVRKIAIERCLREQTGLLSQATFDRDFPNAVRQTLADGGGLSVARFSFAADNPRAQLDGARIISRLMRQTDFGAMQSDGSVIVVFANADLRNAHGIARRLTTVMRHTESGKRGVRSEPSVTVASLSPQDSAKSLLARLTSDAQRAAS